MRFVFLLLLLQTSQLRANDPTLGQQFLALVYERQDNAGRVYPHMADPPLWPQGKYLLEGESNHKLHALVDQLAAYDTKSLFANPREQALVQNALWQVFAYMTLDLDGQREARAALRPKLARAIQRAALSAEELAALPDNLATAEDRDLAVLLARDSPWIASGMKSEKPVAALHFDQLHGSSFAVFLKHPAGRAAGLRLLDELAKVPFPLARNLDGKNGSGFFVREAVTVPFPNGTQVALLRRMLLVDRAGRIVASPIAQTLQIRTRGERAFEPRKVEHYDADSRMQEFHLDRTKYLAGDKASLVPVQPDERKPAVFQQHGNDPFEEKSYPVHHPIVLQQCAGCHRDRGAASLNSFTRIFSGVVQENPNLRESTLDRETAITIKALLGKPEWQALQKAWPNP